jgi:RNA polymerase sigma-70 factor (ECF subfamily)
MDREQQPTGDVSESPFTDAFAQHRRYLINIAYRLVGSLSEAEDLVQEGFTRLLRADVDAIDDVRGWLVVVVTRLCLDHLRSARSRREAYVGPWLPEPLVNSAAGGADPADIVILDESVRMALLIVLERLTPAERVVFVLHDVFQFSFEELASMVERSPAACRQLASRARRRISADAGAPRAAVDPMEMRRVAERFIAACASGELQALLEVLDPDVVGWADIGVGAGALGQPSVGRDYVAERVLGFFGPASGRTMVLAEVNGDTGIIATHHGRPFAVLVLAVREGSIIAIYSVVDEAKLGHVRPG